MERSMKWGCEKRMDGKWVRGGGRAKARTERCFRCEIREEENDWKVWEMTVAKKYGRREEWMEREGEQGWSEMRRKGDKGHGVGGFGVAKGCMKKYEKWYTELGNCGGGENNILSGCWVGLITMHGSERNETRCTNAHARQWMSQWRSIREDGYGILLSDWVIEKVRKLKWRWLI